MFGHLNRNAPATAKWSEGCQELGKQSPPATSSLSCSQRGSMAPTASSVSYEKDDAGDQRKGEDERRNRHHIVSIQRANIIAQNNLPRGTQEQLPDHENA